MSPLELSTYVRLKTRTNSTTLTNADLLTLTNFVKNELALEVLEIDEDIFLMPTYESLVAGQREYPFPTNMLSRLKRVEAKLDGTNWLKLIGFDLTEEDNPMTTEANITTHYDNSEGNAKFDIIRKSVYLYSGTITSVTDGLRLWLNTYPADITSMASTTDMSVDPSTTTHGFPEELHGVLSKGVIVEWKEGKEKPIPLTEREVNYNDDVKKAVQSLKRTDYDREILGSVPFDDGRNY